MKPIVIWAKEMDNLKLTREELEEIIQQAYNQGYEVGYVQGQAAGVAATSSPQSPTISPYPTWIGTHFPYNYCTTTTTSDGAKPSITLKG